MSVGYSTLYGDMAGGFAVIRDVPKTLVYRVCQHINEVEGREVIPDSVLQKEPSAELREDQRDVDSLPPYEVLDAILEGLVEKDLALRDLVEQGFEPETVKRVETLLYGSEWKRYQAAPGPRISTKAFWLDRRYPLVNRWRDRI